MADEQPPRLVICDAFWQENKLLGNLHYFESPIGENLRVRFNEKSQPDGFMPVVDGVIYVNSVDVEVRQMPTSHDVPLTYIGDSEINWSEGVPKGRDWQMLIFIFPEDYALTDSKPKPSGAKEFNGRLTVFWLQPAIGEIPRTQVNLKLAEYQKKQLPEIIELINLEASTLGLANLHVVDDPNAINALIRNHKRRLKILNQKATLFGDNTPLEIEVAIKDIKQEIKELQEQRKSLLYDWQGLRIKLAKYFSLEELRTLCFDLHIDSEDFHSRKNGFVRDLIGYHYRRRTISRLIDYCKKTRPNIVW